MRNIRKSTLKGYVTDAFLTCFKKPLCSLEPFPGEPFSRRGAVILLKIALECGQAPV